MRALALALATAAVSPAAAQAQTPRPLQPGTRVHVTSPALVHREADALLLNAIRWDAEGAVVTSGDVLRVQPRGSDRWVDIPIQSVERLRVLTGEARATGRGAFLGAIAGLAAGALVIGVDQADGEIDPECGEDHCYGVGFRALTLGAGVAVGALVGSAFRTREWRDVALPGLRVVPAGGVGGWGRVEIGVSF